MPYTTPQAKKMLYYIQEAGDFTAYSQYYTERENLNSFLIVYTLSGDGKLLYRKNEYPLRAGSVFFINCMDYQLYQNDSKYPWHFLWIHFNGCSSLAYFEEFMKGGTPVLYTEEISREEEYCIAFPGRMPEGGRPVIEENLRSILNCCADMKFQTETHTSHTKIRHTTRNYATLGIWKRFFQFSGSLLIKRDTSSVIWHSDAL